MTPEERLDRIRQQTAKWETQQAEQDALLQERLNKTLALLDRNAEAMNQQIEMVAQLRPIVLHDEFNASDLEKQASPPC